MAGQRTNYLTWDEYFMGLTALAALQSKKEAKGACIVDLAHRILSVGYEEVLFQDFYRENISPFTMDPLSSALYNFKGRRQELEKGTAYLSSFPNCDESRHIAQAKLDKIIYLTKNVSKEVEDVSRTILDCAGVKMVPYYDELYSLEEYKIFLKELKQILRFHIGKRKEGPLLLDEYFMSIAVLSALRSKDPSTQVGACLVDQQNHVLSISYNGAPYNMSDDILPWHSDGEKTGNLFRMKDPYVVHAEMNAFDNYRGNQTDLKHAKLYLLYSPCENCSKRICISGIDEVIYLREYKKNGVSKKSMHWLHQANILSAPYDITHDYTKEECLHLIQDTTKVIKKRLEKGR